LHLLPPFPIWCDFLASVFFFPPHPPPPPPPPPPAAPPLPDQDIFVVFNCVFCRGVEGLVLPGWSYGPWVISLRNPPFAFFLVPQPLATTTPDSTPSAPCFSSPWRTVTPHHNIIVFAFCTQFAPLWSPRECCCPRHHSVFWQGSVSPPLRANVSMGSQVRSDPRISLVVGPPLVVSGVLPLTRALFSSHLETLFAASLLVKWIFGSPRFLPVSPPPTPTPTGFFLLPLSPFISMSRLVRAASIMRFLVSC